MFGCCNVQARDTSAIGLPIPAAICRISSTAANASVSRPGSPCLCCGLAFEKSRFRARPGGTLSAVLNLPQSKPCCNDPQAMIPIPFSAQSCITSFSIPRHNNPYLANMFIAWIAYHSTSICTHTEANSISTRIRIQFRRAAATALPPTTLAATSKNGCASTRSVCVWGGGG